jgi:hypothetical protein
MEWLNNFGFVSPGVRQGVKIEVIHKDGTRCISDDFDHRDLWTPEKGYGAKNIVAYRFL